jgi:hypothetical protein
MRRATGYLTVAFLATVLGGCSGGVQEGMPSNAVAARPPEELTKQMQTYAKEHSKAPRRGPRNLGPPLGPLPRR